MTQAALRIATPGEGASPVPDAAKEWRENWLLVLAATVGFSTVGVPALTIGLFMAPLHAAFGWGRAEMSLSLSIGAVSTILLSPLVGATIDRYGPRVLAIPGLILCGLAMAGWSLANGSFAQWMVLSAFYAIAATTLIPPVWTTPVSRRFQASRGLALGVTLMGVGVTQVVAPPLARWLIDTHGWRAAFAILGLGWATLALPLVVLFFDRKPGLAIAGEAPPPPMTGLSRREALRSGALARIGATSFITMFFGFAMIVHQVPILHAAGVTTATAAYLASLAGVAAIFGKLGTGWMMDRWNAGLVGGITLAMPAIAFLTLFLPYRTPATIVFAMVIIGYCAGSKLQISAHLTGVYGGAKHYGAIFGMIGSLISIGSGLGPVVAGAVFDAVGSYGPFLLGGAAGSLVSGYLISRLGPYPDWEALPMAG
jgi:predicted MFS family arabinose efflux permease